MWLAKDVTAWPLANLCYVILSMLDSWQQSIIRNLFVEFDCLKIVSNKISYVDRLVVKFHTLCNQLVLHSDKKFATKGRTSLKNGMVLIVGRLDC